MKTVKFSVWYVISVFIMLCVACGGGGSSGGSGSQSTSTGTGTVAVFMTDGPTESYREIWVTITDVVFIPPDGSGRDSVIVYHSNEGCRIDLLAYQGEDFFLTRKKIPSGTYAKIRLGIKDIEPVGGACEGEHIKLPSGRIDLVPQRLFHVEKNDALAIRLDVDAEKSINLHPAGKSGKCIFRPVVFVDIEPMEWQQRCPKIMRGEIVSTIDENNDDDIEGFIMDLHGDRGTVNVYLSDITTIFDDDGLPGDKDALTPGETVWVRGRFDRRASFQASEVAVGGIVVLKGSVDSAVDGQENTFMMNVNPEQIVSDDTISVALSDETLILTGCDDETDKSAIQPGLPTRVCGKLSLSNQVLQAVAVFIRPISGELISIEPGSHEGTEGYVTGSDLLIQVDDGTEVSVFMPSGAPVKLIGDGDVPFSLLCEGRRVAVVIDPDLSDELAITTAAELKVNPDQLYGGVDDVDADNRTMIVEGTNVNVQEDATIMDLRGHGDELVELKDIDVSDTVSIFGLDACPPGTEFNAFVILLVNADE